MHNSYFLLRLLSKQLNSEIAGMRIADIFSQQKDELIITLNTGESRKFIRASFSPEFSCISFPAEFSRAKRNCVDLFKQIYGFEIIRVVQISNDRSFYIELEEQHILLFKMHGNKSNVVLLHDGIPIDLFRKKLFADQNISLTGLHREVTLTEDCLKIHDGNYNQCLPTLSRGFDQYLQSRAYWHSDIPTKLQILQDLLLYLESPDIYIHINTDKKPLLVFHKLDDEDAKFAEPLQALNELYRLWVSDYLVNQKKELLKHQIIREIEKAQFSIVEQNRRVSELENSANYRLMADILMANLHQVKPHEASIILPDFYSGNAVEIRLNPNLSPQDNATRYYKKAKNQQVEIDRLKVLVAAKEQYVGELKIKLSSVEHASSFKELGKTVEATQSPSNLPYHHIIYLGYEIFIGKNATKNEQLTFEVAHKNDLFLHACDAPGSHIIIKHKPGQNFPLPVLEKAASFAAFSSKSKNESLARVAYTLRKYVRKSKGAPAGTVIIEKEKTILVKPESFNK